MLMPLWMRHMRNAGLRDPVVRILNEDPFAVFARDPFFRDPWRVFRQAVAPEIEHTYSDYEVKADGQKVEVRLDVKDFKPDQIHVKTVGNEITVEGKREVKSEDGWTRSHFERRFLLPDGFPPERVECHLDKEKLRLIAFRAEPLPEREVPVQDASASASASAAAGDKQDTAASTKATN